MKSYTEFLAFCFLLVGPFKPLLAAEQDVAKLVATQQSEIQTLRKNLQQFERFAIYAKSCSKVFKDLIAWQASAFTPASNGANRTVRFVFTHTKLKTGATGTTQGFGFGAFAEGEFSLDAGNLVAPAKIYFSDRKSGSQGFSISAADDIKLTLTPDGRGFINFVTWGNGRSDFEGLVCTEDGFGAQMAARYREGNGTSLLTLAFHKTQF